MTNCADRADRTRWFDAHLDLAYLAAEGRDLSRPANGGTGACVAYPDLSEGPIDLCLGTIFTDPIDPTGASDAAGATVAGRAQLQWYLDEERAGRVRIVRFAEDLEQVAATRGPLGVILLMEGAAPIRDPGTLAWWFEQGVRAIGLTWARGSQYAGGNGGSGGLTPIGRELVAAIDALGVVHDASHLSDKSFEDLVGATSARIVASHSNLRRLVRPEARHLLDDQAREIARRDGAIGLNLYSRFLRPHGRATLDDCLDQIEAIASLAGRDRVGLGSDLDGGFTTADLPEGLDHPCHLHRLDGGLALRGWNDRDRAAFRFGTWFDLFRRALPRRRASPPAPPR